MAAQPALLSPFPLFPGCEDGLRPPQRIYHNLKADLGFWAVKRRIGVPSPSREKARMRGREKKRLPF